MRDHNEERALDNFKQCAAEAPEGLFQDAKALHNLIGDTCTTLMLELRELGLKANNCDLIYQVECAIYQYAKGSNPETSMFASAEGFGAAMSGPARERVLSQALRDRDFLANVNAIPVGPVVSGLDRTIGGINQPLMLNAYVADSE